MDKPEKRKKPDNPKYIDYDKGYNHCHKEFEDYYEDLLGALKKNYLFCKKNNLTIDVLVEKISKKLNWE